MGCGSSSGKGTNTAKAELKKEDLVLDKNDAPASTGKLDSQVSKKKTTSEGKPVMVFVLGGPGSGKGTQCDRIKKDYGLVHLSTGDLLREEMAHGSEIGKKISGLMGEGKLVPSEIPVQLLKQAMEDRGWTKNQYLIDGFPRNQENIDVFQKVFGDNYNLKAVLCYDCSAETMEKRILERGKTSGRSDDNSATVKKRIDTYNNETQPVIQHYEKLSLVKKISAEGGVEDVYKETKKALDAVKSSFPNAGKKTEAIFVIGGPGSGKGTQCDLIKKDYKVVHVSVGDLMRAEKDSGSNLGREIDSYMSKGQLVPSSIPVRALKRRFESEALGTVFLVDGFPRNSSNLDEWEKIIGNSVDMNITLYFECKSETMEHRMLERAKTSGRADDTPEIIQKRLKTFFAETDPVIHSLEAKGVVKKIDAEKDPKTIYDEVKKILDKKFKQ